jgi:hypothetical protein
LALQVGGLLLCAVRECREPRSSSGWDRALASARRCAGASNAAERESGAPPELVVYTPGNSCMGPLIEMSDELFETARRTSCYGGSPRPRGGAAHAPRGRHADLHRRHRLAARAPPDTAFASAKAALRGVAWRTGWRASSARASCTSAT